MSISIFGGSGSAKRNSAPAALPAPKERKKTAKITAAAPKHAGRLLTDAGLISFASAVKSEKVQNITRDHPEHWAHI
jgi:hypothetical protein